MADTFVLNLDLSAVIAANKELAAEIQVKLAAATQALATQTHAKVLEMANEKLHSRLEEFTKNLDFEQIDDNTWSIVIKEPAVWIEDGMEPKSMLDSLLSSPKAKMGKNGKYIVVPFKHDKGAKKQTPHQQAITTDLKRQLKRLKVPFKAIEKNPDGSPKLGLLHKIDLQPSKNALKSGFPMVGKHSGRPLLQGVRIYQHLDKNNKARRDIFTFRTASANSSGWFHPGTQPMHFLENAYLWASATFDSVIAPQILDSLGQST